MAKRKSEATREAEVSRRHAEIYRRRQEELVRNPTRDIPSLAQQMKEMREHLEALPEDQEFSMQATDDLDDCRIECHHLKSAIEAILESLLESP